ncbi:MAG: hypothetical protein GU356_07110 [Pyrobaculum sp.]|nr:hypothetical protein [Pyrobaculum sp.]
MPPSQTPLARSVKICQMRGLAALVAGGSKKDVYVAPIDRIYAKLSR